MEKGTLKELCELNGIGIPESALAKFSAYKELLKKWGKKINLTSVLDDRGIEEKHFFDSLLGLKAFEVYGFNPHGKLFCDVGSGAGFPGIPLSIVLPDSKFVLVESKKKKCVFLEEVKRSLNLTNVSVLCSRIENVEERFDVLTMRAVKDPWTAVKITKRLLEKGALLCIYRGKESFKGNLDGYSCQEVEVRVKGVNFTRKFLFIERA